MATAIANARAYEEERKRAEALAELDRAKTAFFSNVSHEFRTPLTLMLGPGRGRCSPSRRPLAPGERELLEVVHRNGLRLLKLVNTLLDFSRIEAGRVAGVVRADRSRRRSPRELASVFRSAVERAGLALRVDCPPLPEPVYVDRDMWEKIVLNLLSNAFKFTFEGEIARLAAARRGDGVELAVRDTGIGIPADELPHVCSSASTASRARAARTHEGTGIGLALVQELVKLHGGTVGVESALGAGTTFTVTIPLGDRRTCRAEQHRRRTHARLDGARRRALRRGGAALARRTTSRTADAAGRTSRRRAVAATARILRGRRQRRHARLPRAAARRALDGRGGGRRRRRRSTRRGAQPPDLVLADVMMPRLDGFGAPARAARRPATAGVPVVLLSARAGEESRVEGLEAGADDYLVKPSRRASCWRASTRTWSSRGCAAPHRRRCRTPTSGSRRRSRLDG